MTKTKRIKKKRPKKNRLLRQTFYLDHEKKITYLKRKPKKIRKFLFQNEQLRMM